MDLNLESTIGFQGIFETPHIVCNFDRYLHFSDKKMHNAVIELSKYSCSLTFHLAHKNPEIYTSDM